VDSDFQHCIRCTICVENCPVFTVNPEFPGPKQAGPDTERFRCDDEKSIDTWIRLCSQCKRCEVSCPYGVSPADIILKEQLRYSETHFRPLTALLFARTHALGAVASLVTPLVNRAASLRLVKYILRLFGMSTYMPLPEYRFHTLDRSRRRKGKRKSPRKVVFFYGCYLNYNRPDIGRGIRDLLVSFGLRVVMPKQVCCGLPALGNSDFDKARRYALKNAAVLADYIDEGYDVIYACTSCGLTLTHDYPGILNVPEGKKIAENTYNLHEYILKLMDEEYLKLDFKPVRRRVAYHIPCHLRALGIGYPAALLFEKIPGLEQTILEDTCCGLAGSYGFKKKNSATAMELGKIAAAALQATAPNAIVADCGACRMQLQHFTRLPALDPSEILIESLRPKGEKP